MKSTRLLVGAIFCATGALLYGVNLLAAAIYATTVKEWVTSWGKVGQAYTVVGHGPEFLGLVFMLVGFGYIIGVERPTWKTKTLELLFGVVRSEDVKTQGKRLEN